MKTAIDKKIRVGYISAFVLLLFSYLLLFFTSNKIVEQKNWLNQKNAIIAEEEKLLSTLKDMETVYRGYLLMGHKESLNLYYGGTSIVDSSIKKLAASLKNDQPQMEELNKLNTLIKEETTTLHNGLSVQTGKANELTDLVKNISYNGKILMDTIRRSVLKMQAYQSFLINQKHPTNTSFFYLVKIINYCSLIIATIIALYSLLTYMRENKAMRRSDENALLYSTQLEQRVKELAAVNIQLNELKSLEKFDASGRMARMIAHEVRNPLTNIGLANDQLKDAIVPTEETAMLIDMIQRNGERINHLISDLLTATKFVELNCIELSIHDVVDEVIEMADDRIKLKDIKIEKDYKGNTCTVLLDKDKMKVALLNIILNAIEAVAPGSGKIQVTISPVNDMCEIIVRDNGVGISEESLPKLFEPFFTKKNKSNGLGLTNAQNVILNHKGSIGVESVVGKGSSFTINLHCAN